MYCANIAEQHSRACKRCSILPAMLQQHRQGDHCPAEAMSDSSHWLQEWTSPKPSKRPEIAPDLEKLETPEPVKMPGDPEQPEDEEWAEEQKKKGDNNPDKEPPQPGEEEEDEKDEDGKKKKKKKKRKDKEQEEDDEDEEKEDDDGLVPKPQE